MELLFNAYLPLYSQNLLLCLMIAYINLAFQILTSHYLPVLPACLSTSCLFYTHVSHACLSNTCLLMLACHYPPVHCLACRLCMLSNTSRCSRMTGGKSSMCTRRVPAVPCGGSREGRAGGRRS